jgi:hypothetical protein
MEKGDPPLNPYGRPPRLVSQILRDMKEDGMEAVTPGQVSDVISVLLNYSVEQVLEISKDKKLPIILQRTARRFAGANDKDWDSVIKDNLDRAHGKALQRKEVDHTGSLEISGGNEMTPERIEALKILLGKNEH